MESAAAQKKEGLIKFFNKAKGYGFLKETDGTELFVHITKCDGEITKDDHVEYSVEEGKRGPQAINVKRI